MKDLEETNEFETIEDLEEYFKEMKSMIDDVDVIYEDLDRLVYLEENEPYVFSMSMSERMH
jgi:hypothetical protein